MDHSQTYREEAYELLSELEHSLLELEERPDDQELIGRVFRAMHTIKGSGAMFGFDEIVAFTHEIETVFDLVRGGEIPVTKELIDLTLIACDQIRQMIEGELSDEVKKEEIILQFRKLACHDIGSPQESRKNNLLESQPENSERETTYRICFRPASNIFTTGTNPILLLNELRDMGECSVIARTDEIPDLEDLNAERCYIYWDIILTTVNGENAIRDVFVFVEDESSIDIKIIEKEDLFERDSEYKRIGEILVDKKSLSPENLENTLTEQKRIGEMLVNAGKVKESDVRSALEEQRHIKKIMLQRKEETRMSSLRVASDKLDTLVDLVGELVTMQARLNQHTSEKKDAELLSISEEVGRLISELRDNTMGIRMLPIGSTFNKFKRLVRDLSNNLAKDVVLFTEGGETELDKTVIESINDPLVHIIRNSIDHGIEPPEVRKKAGKPEKGKVILSASHSGGSVIIRITDDGAGMDPEVIRAKAIERGLIGTDTDLTEKEILSLIFEPGFSTASKLTDVSGRGVGMDVVKRSIESLRGFIDVENQKGLGTSITLKLPLTLAIIDGLLVDVGKERYIMPLSAVEECLEITREEADKANERGIINFRGNIVPYLGLRNIFDIDDTVSQLEQVVMVEANGETIGFGVDRLIGQSQIVIKTLNKIYRDVKGLSGATILGDGTVALILDITQLIQARDDNAPERGYGEITP